MTDSSEAPTATSASPVDRAAVEPLPVEPLHIEGFVDPVILRYFETMNAGDYQATASLFAVDGVMNPPFESAIGGREAIVEYLNHEAKGMQLQPRQGLAQPLDAERIEVTVTGKVQTPLFGVNVNWIFVLNRSSEIILARIKLIASPQELLNLRR